MAYQLYCKECGTDISAHQYDAHLGLCLACFAEAEDLHDGLSWDYPADGGRAMYDDEDPDEADQRGLSNMPYQ
jgi:hypothetical protein